MTQVAPFDFGRSMPRLRRRFRTTSWSWLVRSVETKRERINRSIERLQTKVRELDVEIAANEVNFGNKHKVEAALARDARLRKKRGKIDRKIVDAQEALRRL